MPSFAADCPREHSASQGVVSPLPTEAAQPWEKTGASTILMVQGTLSFLGQMYTLREPERISRFFEENEHPDLIRLLAAAYPSMKYHIPNSQVFLEVANPSRGTNGRSQEASGDQLRISLATDLEGRIIIEQLDYLEQRWLDAFPGAQGKVALALEALARPIAPRAPGQTAEDEDEDEGISASLVQLLDVMTRMDDEALWQIARRNTLTHEAHAGLDKLQAKRRRKGALSHAEEQHQDELLEQYDEGVLIRSQALALLKQRGRNIDELLVLP